MDKPASIRVKYIHQNVRFSRKIPEHECMCYYESVLKINKTLEYIKSQD